MGDVMLEANVLFALANYEECQAEIMASLGEEDFSEHYHRLIFRTARHMYESGATISLPSLAKECEHFIMSYEDTRWVLVRNAYILPGNVTYYIHKLKEVRHRAQLDEFADRLQFKLLEDVEFDVCLRFAEDELYKIACGCIADPVLSPAEQAERMKNTLDTILHDANYRPGWATSFTKLNKCLNGGYHPEELHIIAAQTGHGKTAFAMNLVRDLAIVTKKKTLYINTEMNACQLDLRWLSILTAPGDITYAALAAGNIGETSAQCVREALERMANSGFHSVTIPDLTLAKLISTARKFAAQTGLDVLVVDYIGRMDTTDARLAEWQVLKNAAKRLKTLSQELKIAVIMLAQLNEFDRLEGSKAMKNEADFYGCLRPLKTAEETKGEDTNYCLAVEKNRNGPTGRIKLKFVRDKLLFTEGGCQNAG